LEARYQKAVGDVYRLAIGQRSLILALGCRIVPLSNLRRAQSGHMVPGAVGTFSSLDADAVPLTHHCGMCGMSNDDLPRDGDARTRDVPAFGARRKRNFYKATLESFQDYLLTKESAQDSIRRHEVSSAQKGRRLGSGWRLFPQWRLAGPWTP
jgi:hypothetical protein